MFVMHVTQAMKVIVTGILMASYLSINYRLKQFVIRRGNLSVELFITLTLVISVAFSQSSEPFVWSLFILLVVWQIAQLKTEVETRIRNQKLEGIEEEELRKSA